MNKKADRRILKTRAAIKEAFFPFWSINLLKKLLFVSYAIKRT